MFAVCRGRAPQAVVPATQRKRPDPDPNPHQQNGQGVASGMQCEARAPEENRSDLKGREDFLGAATTQCARAVAPLHTLEDAGCALPHPHTHSHHAVLELMPLQRMNHRRSANRAGRAQRMA